MVDGGYRPGARIELALVAGQDNTLEALSATIFGDAGNAIDSVVRLVMSQVYDCPARAFCEYDVVSHLPPGKPFRAPGGPPANFAIEQAIDMMAERLGKDPIALRRQWDRHEGRQRLYEWAAGLEAWRTRSPVGSQKGRRRRGVGVAMANWLSVYGKHVRVEVIASKDGITARTAVQDMGNGARSVIAHAVAGVLGVSPLEVKVEIGNSSAPRGVSSAASATTNAVYWPSLKAAERVRDQLVAAARARGLLNPQAGRGGIDHAGGHVPWRELVGDQPLRATVKRGTDDGVNPMSLVPIGASGATIGKGMTGEVCVAEVEVDTRLGRIHVSRVFAGINAGKIVVPTLARSQICGGIIQSLGYALYEERQIDERTGHVLSYNLEDYRLPGIADIPEMVIHFDERGFEHVKGAAAGLSELSTLPVASAIANAVYNATGWRPLELPIRPDRVLSGVRQ
jgi:xanthine dehydrogenase YagR molybdenum-binding subunit